MRLLLAALVLAAVGLAYVLPTEAMDTFYWASPDAVRVVGADGATLFSLDAVFPLVATDAAGRCFAVVNRPYVYLIQRQSFSIYIVAPTSIELSDDIINALRQYGISIPKRIYALLNLTLPLPPAVIAGVYKGTIVSLHAPYGYPHWSTSLGPQVNATAVATNCVDVLVGDLAGRIFIIRGGRVIATVSLPAPVTSATYTRDGKMAYVGTAGGEVYKVEGSSAVKVFSCPGSVLGLAALPDGSPVAACFSKGDVPKVYVAPYGLEFVPAVVVEYGIDTPRVPFAVSQNGEWVFVGTFGELVAIRRGSVAWRAPLPAPPLSVYSSGDGSIVAVGTLGGHVVVFREGREVARISAGRPVTSLAASFNGRALAYETWDSVKTVRLASVRIVPDAPQQCLPVDVVVRTGDAVYTYSVSGAQEVLAPVGKLSVEPQFKYLGDVRCRPLGNATLEVTGDLAEPVPVRYVLEYRVSVEPAGLVRGPAWASGSAAFYAEPRVEIPVYNSPVTTGVLRLVGWVVDGRRLDVPTPSLTVNVDKPTSIKAIYRVELPRYVQLNATARLRLDLVVVFDGAGNVVASGPAPEVSTYPVSAQGVYVPQALVSTSWPATVNGSTQLWADVGSTVVFKAPEFYDFRNGTRLAFVGWAGLEFTPEERALEVVRAVQGPLSLRPKYVVQYRVWVAPPAYVANPPNATWVERGVNVTVSIPTPIESRGNVRTVLAQWVVNGRPAGSRTPLVLRVDKPLNITYTAKRQYLVYFTSAYGQVPPQMWVDEGGVAGVVPTPMDVWSPPPLHWVFAGWRDKATGTVYNYPQMPVVVASTTFEAVWSLDPIPLVAVGGGAAGAAFLVWFIRRRRLARLVAEVEKL